MPTPDRGLELAGVVLLAVGVVSVVLVAGIGSEGSNSSTAPESHRLALHAGTVTVPANHTTELLFYDVRFNSPLAASEDRTYRWIGEVGEVPGPDGSPRSAVGLRVHGEDLGNATYYFDADTLELFGLGYDGQTRFPERSLVSTIGLRPWSLVRLAGTEIPADGSVKTTLFGRSAEVRSTGPSSIAIDLLDGNVSTWHFDLVGDSVIPANVTIDPEGLPEKLVWTTQSRNQGRSLDPQADTQADGLWSQDPPERQRAPYDRGPPRLGPNRSRLPLSLPEALNWSRSPHPLNSDSDAPMVDHYMENHPNACIWDLRIDETAAAWAPTEEGQTGASYDLQWRFKLRDPDDNDTMSGDEFRWLLDWYVAAPDANRDRPYYEVRGASDDPDGIKTGCWSSEEASEMSLVTMGAAYQDCSDRIGHPMTLQYTSRMSGDVPDPPSKWASASYLCGSGSRYVGVDAVRGWYLALPGDPIGDVVPAPPGTG